MKWVRPLATVTTLLASGVLFGCQKTRTAKLDLPPPPVEDRVELNDYAGKWFEIARLPNSFQEGCTNTTATYSLNEDGTVRVKNACRKGGLGGKWKTVQGKARVVEGSNNAKLKVSFFWPFSGNYWILDVADDYSYALVGAPSRESAWILSRDRRMDSATYQKLVEQLAQLEYETDRLIRTQHDAPASDAP